MVGMNFYLKILVSLGIQFTVLVCAGSLATARTHKLYKQIQEFGVIPFEDCGSLYDIQYLNISSCGTIPCKMSRGSVVLVNVVFDDKGRDIKFLKNHVRWVFNSIKTNAEITPDPCNGHDECILTIKNGKSYRAKVFVNSNLPIVRGLMLWEAVDEYNQEVICFKVPVTIRY